MPLLEEFIMVAFKGCLEVQLLLGQVADLVHQNFDLLIFLVELVVVNELALLNLLFMFGQCLAMLI